jgi:hypothetical protein
MKFRHEDLRTGDTFACRMRCGQCNARAFSGRQCRNYVCIGRKYCHIHTQAQEAGVGGEAEHDTGAAGSGGSEEEFDESDDVIVGESKTQDEVLRERQTHAERTGQVIEVD